MRRKIIFVLFFVFSLLLPTKVFADMGPKPSIDVKIKNLKTTNYLVDLFVYDQDGNGYNSPKDYNGDGLSEAHISKLYELNYDGWISESTRWSNYLLFADCAGNNNHTHHFSYFGTPTEYKIVVINNDTGEIKISDKIERKDFNSSIEIDYKTMISTNSSTKSTIFKAIIALLLTVLIELIIAYLFKTGYYKTIIITNIITNLLLQIILFLLVKNYILAFIIGELIVLLSELFIYLFKFKGLSKKRIIIYTLCANIATIIISFLLINI